MATTFIFNPFTGNFDAVTDVTTSPFGSTPNADGLTVGPDGSSITLEPADATHPGGLSADDWNTFNNKQAALGYTPENITNKGQPNGYAPLDGSAKVPYANLPSALMTFKGAWDPTTNTPTLVNGTGTNGDVYRASVGGTSSGPIVDTWFAGDFIIYNGTIWQRSPLADGVISVNGMAGAVTVNAINQLTGDATAGPASGSQSEALTLATVNSNVGSFGTATQTSTFTVNAKGLVTAASNTSIQIAESQVTNLTTDLAGKQPTGNYITDLTGDVTASGPGSSAATLATVNANVGSFGAADSVANVTVNAKGLVTAASNIPIQITESQVTNLTTDLAGKQVGPLTGDITTSSANSPATTLATVNANVGSFGTTSSIPSFTVNAKGLITAASGNISTPTPTANIFSGWDTNKNLSANSFIPGLTVTTTATGTTTLTVASALLQVFTGTLGQIIKLPVATTLAVGQPYTINNESSAPITLQFQDGSAFTDASGISYTTIPAHQALTVQVQTNATANGTWTIFTSAGSSTGYTVLTPTIQKFLSGTGTYVTPANVAYIRVRMVGGGSGGTGSATTAAGNGGTGGTGGSTTFGSSLLVANGGTGSSTYGGGGSGGTANLGTGPIGIAISGGVGTAGIYDNAISGIVPGGPPGTSSPFGGAGGGGAPAGAGYNAIANSGSGGGGAGGPTGGAPSGSGGSAGGYVDALINSPASTYTYSVGSAGTAGTAGTSGFAGGAGGSGYIEVTEYYFNNPAQGVTVTASSVPTVQRFLSGSGTYSTPSGVQYIKVRMVGGGGGGAGSGTSAGTSGATGGNTTFGTSLLAANGGGGSVLNAAGAAGGTASLGTGPIGTALTGGTGSPGQLFVGGTSYLSGGNGATSPLGGAGAGGSITGPGGSAQANTGSGGGGGSAASGSNYYSGPGGGAGGFVDAIINSPTSTYSYSVGAGGTAGTAGGGGSGAAGGTGGSGYIEVTEYYTVLATGGFTGGGQNLPTIQKFTSGTAQTYTTPANVSYIRVRMVGGGGGGGSGGSAGGGTGPTFGGNSSFGTSLLLANGGANGAFQAGGGPGGGASLGTGPIGTVFVGGAGQGSGLTQSTSGGAMGSMGGASHFGQGGGGAYSQAGYSAQVNSGGGGGGSGGNTGNATAAGGSGGGAGGFVDAIISNPSATYLYTVGVGGTGQSAGSGGFAGGNGGSGYIEVTEYYANGSVGTATTITGTVAPKNIVNTAFTPPSLQKFISGSGNYYLNYSFVVSGANATIGATYTVSGVTYTVSSTVASSNTVVMSGNSAPPSSGALTKASGTGDSTILFTSVRNPLYIRVRMVGGGGGGGGSGSASGAALNGVTGGNTYFGALLSATGGNPGGLVTNASGGGGQPASIGVGAFGTTITGGNGSGPVDTSGTYIPGGIGGASAFGAFGAGNLGTGTAAPANTGGGGGGAGTGAATAIPGCGGGAGGHLDAIIPNPLSTYTYTVGAAGTGSSAGTSGYAGGNGGSGYIEVTEYYQ